MLFEKIFGKYIVRKPGGQKVYLRKGKIDMEVYDYVFAQKYHRPYREHGAAPVILDLGTNIGLSIVDLKLQYPSSVIYGFEMDKENHELAVKNCKGLEGVTIEHKAIWNERTNMSYRKSGLDDAYKLDQAAGSGTNDVLVETITIPGIIEKYQLREIDYVKMDIEGAELQIFQANLDWLKIVKEIKVEVHYDKSQFAFFSGKLQAFGFTVIEDSHHWSTLIAYK
jgi:FkbM family methyltransferase